MEEKRRNAPPSETRENKEDRPERRKKKEIRQRQGKRKRKTHIYPKFYRHKQTEAQYKTDIEVYLIHIASYHDGMPKHVSSQPSAETPRSDYAYE